jgi:hypothetical protein
MAETSTFKIEACGGAMHAMLEGRWRDWQGLPPDCSLVTLERIFGGSVALDTFDRLGTGEMNCSRSSLNEAPILVWHNKREIFTVECDFLSAPLPAPAFDPDTMDRLDASWGVTELKNGEWVESRRGLALVVTPGNKVVSCFGFAPTGLEHYVSALRPKRQVFQPLPRSTL